MFAYTANGFLALLFGKLSDASPIFFANIGINLDKTRIEAVAPIFLATGDPVVLAGFAVKIIRFEYVAFEAAKLTSSVK